MQLGKSKTLGIFNNHQAGIGYIHSHFNYGSRDQ